MSKPRLLDLFAGAGGAGAGYYAAGFDVTGVDIAPQPNYPFAFVQADAIEYLEAHGAEFDAIHASPVCQSHTWSARRWINSGEREWPDLIPPTRDLLQRLGKPYVIENVVGAPLHRAVMLCGTQFGLPLLRHRWFESNVFLMSPPPCRHSGSVPAGDYITVAGHGGDNKAGNYTIASWRRAMGMPWAATRKELAEAIPPAYTEFLGRQLIDSLKGCAI